MGWNSITVLTSSRDGDQRAIARQMLAAAAAALIPGAAFTLEYTPSGRPHLQRPAFDSGPSRLDSVPLGNPHISVSHTAGLTAVALTGLGPVGIDIEAQRTLDAIGLAKRWYPPSEVDWLTQLPTQAQADGFLTLWVAKESVGKALGTGLRDGALRRPMPESTMHRPSRWHSVPDLPGLAVRTLRLGSGHWLGIAGVDCAHFAVFNTD